MINKPEKSTSPQTKGILLCFFLIILVIADVFLVAFQFDIVDQRWTKVGAYRVLGILELVQIIYTFVVALYGIFSFKTNKSISIVNL